jgi:hypothetical protein
MASELLLQYPGSSVASEEGIELVTTSVPGRAPVFFDGYAQYPGHAAQAMLCVARVARTRFYMPPNMVAAQIRAADPVVTAEPDRLRFESFSACCGVHARFDMLADGLDICGFAPGTTNVDFNPPMREALARIASREPLRITVGQDTVAVETLDRAVVERRVPLPEGWIQGFGEVQVALTRAAPILELPTIAAQRFLKALPRGAAGDRTVWAESTSAGVRFSSVSRPGRVCVAAPSRLSTLAPLARFAKSLIAYGDPDASDPSPVTWVMTLPASRLCVTLSPDRTRGFSGEGGQLLDLISDTAATDAHTVRDTVSDATRFTLQQASNSAGLSPEHTRAALTWLGIHGHLGFDPADDAYFWRHLPYPDELLAADPPRLRDAKRLLAAGAVKPVTGGTAHVHSEGREYRTRIFVGEFSCTCPWIAKHGTSRGPCKHVLATAIFAATTPAHPETPPLTHPHA